MKLSYLNLQLQTAKLVVAFLALTRFTITEWPVVILSVQMTVRYTVATVLAR